MLLQGYYVRAAIEIEMDSVASDDATAEEYTREPAAASEIE